MSRPKVDYDALASTYHSRYHGPNKLDGIDAALRSMITARQAQLVLEVGCGTGRFVESLRETGASVIGLDASPGMLRQAAKRLGAEELVAANANALPFARQMFDVIYCVNAIHHFDDPAAFLKDAARLLKPTGVLTVIGMDPRTIRRRYYYDYFEGALALDRQRYPSFGQLVDWAAEAGLHDVELLTVERAVATYQGRDILSDPFLVKESNSLLALLSDDVYTQGLQRIESAANKGAEFVTDLPFGMVTGFGSPTSSATERTSAVPTSDTRSSHDD